MSNIHIQTGEAGRSLIDISIDTDGAWADSYAWSMEAHHEGNDERIDRVKRGLRASLRQMIAECQEALEALGD